MTDDDDGFYGRPELRDAYYRAARGGRGAEPRGRPKCPHCGAFTRNDRETGAWSCSRCGASGDLA